MYHFASTYVLAATALALAPTTAAGPAPTPRWPPIRFDDRRGVVVLQAPVFVPEMLVKGASFGLQSSPSLERHQPPFFGELSGRRDEWTAAAAGAAAGELAPPIRIVSVDRAEALTLSSRKCTLLCVYGMQTDVEGVELCKCRDPCREVLCQDGEQCVPEKACSGDGCRYRGACQARSRCALGKPRSGGGGGAASSSSSSACLNATRRFYYDERTQRCRKFRGCGDVSGGYGTLRQCSLACEHTRAAPEASGVRRPAPATTATAAATRTSTAAAAAAAAPARAPTTVSRGGDGRRPVAAVPEATAGVGSVVVHMSRQRGDGHDDCPPDQPHHECPYNPCDRCSIPDVVCRPSRCGRCRAVYYNVKTGFSAVREGGGFC